MTNFDLNKQMESWVATVNNSAKWGIALFMRIAFVIGIIIFIGILLRATGVDKGCSDFLIVNGVKIKPEEPKVISKPSTPTYSDDLKDIDAVRKLLQGGK